MARNSQPNSGTTGAKLFRIAGTVQAADRAMLVASGPARGKSAGTALRMGGVRSIVGFFVT